jgi:kinesin family protein C2/C3
MKGTGTVIPGLTEVVVNGPDDVTALIGKGQKNRSVSSTSMNDRSSRSHAMLRVNVTSKNTVIADAPTTTGTAAKEYFLTI